MSTQDHAIRSGNEVLGLFKNEEPSTFSGSGIKPLDDSKAREVSSAPGHHPDSDLQPTGSSSGDVPPELHTVNRGPVEHGAKDHIAVSPSAIPPALILTPSERIPSFSVEIGPVDRRCRWWAKVIRKDDHLPSPIKIAGAASLPMPYSNRGDEELFPGDFLIEGEENNHRVARGWTYWLRGLDSSGEEVFIKGDRFSSLKPLLKQAGISPQLLAGAGEIAAAVRLILAARAGIDINLLCKVEEENRCTKT